MLLVDSGLAGLSDVSIAILEAGRRGPPVRPAAASLADSASSLDLASAYALSREPCSSRCAHETQ
jgi:hypothetical protein